MSVYKLLTRKKRATLLTWHFLVLTYRVFVLFYFLFKRDPRAFRAITLASGALAILHCLF